MEISQNTRFKGTFRELLGLFFPILILTFFNCINLMLEQLWLGILSTQMMEAAITSTYACMIFQGPIIALALMAQVFVGQCKGEDKLHQIGPGIWQFIWSSLLSLLIVIPAGWLYGRFYFHGIDIESIVMPYYYSLLVISFVFPLSAVLFSFFIGQGKIVLVVGAFIIFQAIKCLLAYLLIFGWSDWIPSLGLMGAALSTFLAQGGYCLVLLAVFLNAKNRKLFHSDAFHFNPRLFWECIYPGFMRAGNRFLIFANWASITQLIAAKGDDYLLFLTIGGVFALFLPFVAEALCQAQTTIVANLLGSQQYHFLQCAERSAIFLMLIMSILAAIPFLLFPLEMFQFLFPTISLDSFLIRKLFLGIWICFVLSAFSFIPLSFVLAFQDMRFCFFMGLFNWLTGFIWMYFLIEKVEIAADNFWLALSLMHASTAICYVWRVQVLKKKILLKTQFATQ